MVVTFRVLTYYCYLCKLFKRGGEITLQRVAGTFRPPLPEGTEEVRPLHCHQSDKDYENAEQCRSGTAVG